MFKLFILSLIAVITISNGNSLPEEASVTYDMLFSAGVESYNAARWYECYAYMKRALADYKFYHETLTDCRLECRQSHPTTDQPIPSLELEFYHIALKRSDCIRRCKEVKLDGRPEGVTNAINQEFKELKPYDYLQICAFNADKFEDAASASYTYLLGNPKHEVMQNNVAFYQTVPEIKPSFFQNLEARQHQKLYSAAVDLYGDEDWATAVQNMEEALVQYFYEYERCRVSCEGVYDHQELPELYNAIAGKQLADHWISVLKCHLKCPVKLATWSDAHISNYLQEHYNYLQFAYYKLDDLKKAAECVQSFLLFDPENTVMLQNKMYYLKDGQKVNLNDFVPRKRAQQYLDEIIHMEEMYSFARMEYKKSAADEDADEDDALVFPRLGNERKKGDDAEEGEEDVMDSADEEEDVMEGAERGTDNDLAEEDNERTGSNTDHEDIIDEEKTIEVDDDSNDEKEKELVNSYEEYQHPLPEHVFGKKDEQYKQEFSAYKEKHGMSVSMEDEELKGRNRVVVDDLLNKDECDTLVQLAAIGAKQGDGYAGFENRPSPFTNFEKFEGLTVARTEELVEEGRVDRRMAQLYLDASERARDFLEKYYNLQSKLYFHYTHLVCRTALSGEDQTVRKDLSHPIHADNCYIQNDGSCLKKPPAYVWRDISAILYLNDGFEGGDFFFAHRNQTVQQKVRPARGRMVGFEANHYHGVEALTLGKRCAVALWFTLDPKYQEPTHQLPVEDKQKAMSGPLRDLLEEQGYRISKTEDELNGPERFAADGLATREQCDMLIKLANKHAIPGDGYTYGPSPFTYSEQFAGLTLSLAAEQGGIVGDGYRKEGGYSSPHTQHEMFEGLTVLRAAQLAATHAVSLDAVQTYLNLSHNALDIVQKYFGLTRPLYFDFTHLTCRTAVDGNKLDREDLSHPIHSDNCIIKPDGSCKKEPPAYVQRDYSALLYLNDDFLGGDFFFADKKMAVQSEVQPSCGRLVAFNAGNYHGVHPVLRGQRCSVAMWYTLDPAYDEQAQHFAAKVVDELRNTAQGPDGRKDEL